MEALSVFIVYPWAALGVAAVFAALWARRRRRPAAVAALLWAGYSVYEYLMHVRVLCSGECNIRVDLLLLYPVLLLVSLWAAVSLLRSGSSAV